MRKYFKLSGLFALHLGVLLYLVIVYGCVTTGQLEKRMVEIELQVIELEDQLMLVQAAGVGAATRMYGRDCVDSETDGCAKSMDDIGGTKATGDLCQVLNDDRVYAMYRYDSTIGGTEDYPTLIDDDTQAGSERWVLYNGRIDGNVQFSISDPENLPTHAGRSTSSKLIWHNNTGVTLNIQEIRATSDTYAYTFLLFKSASSTDVGTANDTQIDSVVTDAAGTNCYYRVITTGFDSNAIEDGKFLIFEHSSGTAEDLHVLIVGYLGT